MLGCAAQPAPLPDSAIARLSIPASRFGTLIYTGEVVPRGRRRAAYRYERRVRAGESTHLTRPAGSDEVVVLQRAVHTPAYRLQRFEEVHRQTGVRSAVFIAADGSVELTARRGRDVDRHAEGPGDPVVVGPTLFGFIRRHFGVLVRGDSIGVRFAAPEQGRTYAFTLRAIEITPRTVTIEMAASDLLVSLGIDPMRVVLDRESRDVLRYRGRVPPRLNGLQTFDADVRYEHAADYR